MLTERQLQVLSLVSHGYSNPEIAAELVLEVATVKQHVRRILDQLAASDRAHAVRIAFEDDILTKSPRRRPRHPRKGHGPRPPRPRDGAR